MARLDPHSYADDTQPRTKSFDWQASVDFPGRVLHAEITLHFEEPAAGGPLDLDTRALSIDAVLDATGSIKVMNSSLFHTRNGGNYTLVGVIKGDLVWPDAEGHRRELTIRASRNATREDFDHVMESIRRGLVPTDRLKTHTMSFDQVPTELPRLVHERTGLIKAIISV